jgi:ubiquinone/menaquinone biosynthesis C-methylase UbiE
MAAAPLRPGSSEFDSLLARVRARSASYGAERVRRALLERLAVEKSDSVLELGFGSGRLLFAVAARATAGLVAGVEPEEYALRHARRRCERLVREGRVALMQGTSRDLSAFAPAAFDKVFGVNVAYFWQDALPHLREIRRVLRPGGQVLLGYGADLPSAALERGLAATGFDQIRTEPEDRMVWTSAR